VLRGKISPAAGVTASKTFYGRINFSHFSTLFHGFLSQKTRKSLRLGVFARDIFFGCGYAALGTY